MISKPRCKDLECLKKNAEAERGALGARVSEATSTLHGQTIIDATRENPLVAIAVAAAVGCVASQVVRVFGIKRVLKFSATMLAKSLIKG